MQPTAQQPHAAVLANPQQPPAVAAAAAVPSLQVQGLLQRPLAQRGWLLKDLHGRPLQPEDLQVNLELLLLQRPPGQ